MFNQYPYLNLNDFNLDYILKAIKDMRYEVTNFVSINAIKYANPIQWNITRQYEKNTIVIDPVTGTAYISVAPVPAGVALTRPEYWTVVFDLQSFVTKANQNLANHYEQQTTTTATMNTAAGKWVIWGDVLYKALVNITAGDAYVVGSNIQRIVIEDIINAIIQDIADEAQARQDADDAINAIIGDLNNLTTTDKTSIVNAINDEVSARQGADTAIENTIGDLNNLTTTDKTSIVNAINEVAAADISFDTVNDISGVEVGDVVITKGFYGIGDGGGCIYVVTEDDNNDLPTIYANNMYLMIANEPVNILSLGCKLNDSAFDNSTILNAMFTKWSAAYFAPYGNLYISNMVVIPETFKGSIRFNADIHAEGMAGAAVEILAWNCNTLYFSGIYGDQTASSIGLLMGGTPLTFHVINDTVIVNKIDRFTIGMKLESSNHFGVTNNKFYLTRIDNCDYGIYFEVIGSANADGFITQNQFYNVWVTGDGLNTKTGIWFQDNISGTVHDIFNENNFLNLCCEGCGTIVGGDGIRTTRFDNIRLGEQGPVTLPNLFNLGSHCAYNVFSSNAYYVLYTNITDAGEYNVYNFNFRDPVTQHELGNCGSFRNGKFMLKGECLTQKVFNVGSETTSIIDPYRSASVINVNRVAASPVDIILPNNARESNYAPTLFIRLLSIGGGVRLKDVDGNVLASSDSSGGTALVDGRTYIYFVNYNHSVTILELVNNSQ